LSSTHVFITLGTAWVYEKLDTNQIVANCHKAPQAHFRKVLQSPEQITSDLSKIKEVVRSLNPKAKLIFTVSPVRHLKDGMIENQRSKAHLLSGLHQHLDEDKDDYYFPSYELLLDDLRDYRFYGSDL
ncbi:GSCFA domain-containing protein, partial [Arthrospira platensis SPKY1]|nr:GSCFA domain-containing protein [Arthrospira platensis SPKY1]